MDYMELINHSRALNKYWGAHYDQDFSKTLQNVTDALEEAMAELDAAVEDMKGICSFCAHKKTCQFGNHLRDKCVNGSNWQWRGPQKGGGT